jgi:cell division control protein 6
LKSILNDRIKLGFYSGVMSEDVLDVIVDHTSEAGDLRVGIDLLKRSALNAENRASTTISTDDVQSAYEKSRMLHLSRTIASLSSGEQAILEILAEKRTSTAGDVYTAFHESTGLGYTRFHTMLNKLAALRLIDTDLATAGMHGRSRRITLRYDAKGVMSAVRR